MTTERSLVLVKPDGFARGLSGEVLRRIEAKGYRLLALQVFTPDRERLHEHYAEHRGKPFFEPLCEFMSSGPVTAAVIEHVGAHSALYTRALGATSGASSLHPLLSRHFAESVTQLLSQHGVEIPTGESPDAEQKAYVAESAARFIADGTVGAIDVWLRTPEPRNVDSFLAVYRLIMPAWWPLEPTS